MNPRRVRIVVFAAVFLVVMSVYLLTVAPTAAFWDCGELIAVACTMGVPHPPGTPLFVTIGRIFSMLPTSPEYAFRINLIPVLFGAFSCGLIYLLVIELISFYANPERRYDKWLPHVAGAFAALACAFAFSFWDNSVEAEVYGPCVVVALSVLYMGLAWRDQLQREGADNRLILAAIFLLFLSTGIHFTPMMTVFAVLVFGLVVDRESIIQLRIFELVAGYLTVLTVTELGLTIGTFIAVPLMLGATWAAIRVMEQSTKTRSVFYGLGLFFLVFVVAYVAAGNEVMDDTVLFLASPTVAFIERWVQSPVLLVLFVAGYGGYLYWLHRQRKLRPKYVALMLGLVLLAGTVQFIMFTRARMNPSINEVNPSNWRDFVSVLKREQYDPMKLLPRKTQFLTENEWRMDQNPRFSVLVAYYEQVKYYVRYFFWQWGNPRFFDIFLNISWQALLGLIPPLLGLWGMWHQFKNEKRSFVLILVAFLVASIGLVTYLNLKYSPSDPRRGDPAMGKLGYLEVRERDYFFAFSFVFYTIFIGVGAYAFLRRVADWVKSRKLPVYAVSAALLAFGFVPMALNYQTVTRHGDWIPAEYGYNMLVSCPGEHAVLFTNGDNDTFPLWFMQTVPSRVAKYDPQFGKNVAVANLSLLNTNWYCKQLKRWGAPISFTESQIDKLPQGFVGKDNRTYLLKDIMMRDIVATSAGVKLKWPDDYGCTPQEFRAKVFTPDYTPRTPVYYATTVSRENLADVEPNLRLEGLVNRVVTEQRANQVDVEKTRHMLYDVYVMNSMLDPRVEKDENTRGLLINYAASYLALASEYQKSNRYAEAQEVIEKALSFNLDSDRRLPLFYHASVFAMLNGKYDQALVYLDSIERRGLRDPELSFRRGLALQGKREFTKAEAAYLEAIAQDPNRPDPLQALYQLYLEDIRDTNKARALLQQWLKRAPNDSLAVKMLKEIS
jgi:tetratricopeptide (TPR) repeat protein